MKYMHRRIITLSLVSGLVLSLLAAGFGYSAVMGVWLGVAMGLAGYWMIVRMTETFTDASQAKTKGTGGYWMRYGFYALVFVMAMVLHLPIGAVLAGYLDHKAMLLLYTWLEGRRKE